MDAELHNKSGQSNPAPILNGADWQFAIPCQSFACTRSEPLATQPPIRPLVATPIAALCSSKVWLNEQAAIHV